VSYPRVPHEEERLQALSDLQILDTPPDPLMSAACAEAAREFGVPIALITLIDRHRQWFKACIGLAVCETPREPAFCNYTIVQEEPFVVPDTLLDSRFSGNPFVVGEPRIRFYAGAPLRFKESIRLGSFCIVDTKPRSFSEGDKAKLERYADRVVGYLWRHHQDVLPRPNAHRESTGNMNAGHGSE
jgi:GAF domain-containing protein